jgi:tetratricopeptide (TPR) repeat protein
MNNNFDLIDSYLKGELTPNEQADFDNKLQDDVKFQAEFYEIKLIRDALKKQVRSEILTQLKNQESDITIRKSNKTHTIMKRYIGIAASLILIVSLVYLTTNKTEVEIDGNTIFLENYQAYVNLELGTERGSDLDVSSLKAQAYYAYDLGNYEQSSADLTKLVATEKTAANYFYLGISNIEIGNMETSFANFNTVINNFEEYKEQAQWFLALALLKEGETDQALSNLVSLVVKEGSFKNKSSELILNHFGIDLGDSDHGTGPILELKPLEKDAPGELVLLKERKIQYGTVLDRLSGEEYEFFNDEPLKGLKIGDEVDLIILKKGKKGKSKGFGFILRY